MILNLNELDGPRIVAILSNEMQRWYIHGRSLSDLARKANLSPVTVSNIWYRKTTFPRVTTVLMVMHALGYNAVKFERGYDGYRLATKMTGRDKGYYVRPDDGLSFSPSKVFPTEEEAWAAFEQE